MRTRLKAIDPKAAEPSKPKILIYGSPGVGKTWNSLDFPSVYFIDTEGGANLPRYTDKLKASGGIYFGPDQGSQSFDAVLSELQALATEDHDYKTVVIDSISKLWGLEISREADRLGDKDAFGASKKPAVAYIRRLISWIDRLDMNVILIAHEKAQWEGGEQKGFTFDAYEKLEYELHLALRIVKGGDNRVAQVRKSRLEGFPDRSTFPWSYVEFANRYGKDVIEKKGTHIELATEEQVAEINRLLGIVKLEEGWMDKLLTKAKAEAVTDLSTEQADKTIIALKGKLI